MRGESTPGQTGSVPCSRCGGSIFFVFTGGPHKLRCPQCKTSILLEVVYNGRKWQTKLGQEPPP